MNNILLYAITVLVWGTTWFAIKMQTGYGADVITILDRCGLASLLMVLWCKFKNISLQFSRQDHLFLFGLGLSMFSLHYLFVYKSCQYAISGVVAIVFSTVSFLNILNNYIFFRVKPSFNVCLGALIGFVGLCLFFWDEVAQASGHQNILKGLTLAVIGTLIFSFGGSISKRNNRKGLEMIPCVTVAMVYGFVVMLAFVLSQQSQFFIPHSFSYWAALLYLVLPGSIMAFLCYLQLVKNIGPELAGYTTVVFPVVAFIVSSFLEGFEWSTTDVVSLLLVIMGNIVVMQKKSFWDLIPKRLSTAN